MFQTSFYLLELTSCDVVLEIQRLQTLGFITWDFSELLMTFDYAEKSVILKGIKLKHSIVEDGHKLLNATLNKVKGIFL